MADQIVTKKELEAKNVALQERIEEMENMIAKNAPVRPDPKVYYDPFDADVNPHHIKKHPEGKVLSWKNPNIRNGSRGWRGWVPITYDDEIGAKLKEYIPDPPAKMAGSADQDNYVRRGTDSILCWLPEEMWKARQQKREAKALRKQIAAGNPGNTTLRNGVDTFGNGVEVDQSPPGGFKLGNSRAPQTSEHQTVMFDQEE